ncbi:pyridoxal-phosphate dependent enzyme, partial [Acinetobacter baumannii]
KAESLQPVGAFKLRGAWHRLTAIEAKMRERGVVAFSSGNHAQGVAWAAKRLGIPAVIVMPSDAPVTKREATLALGAEIVT